MGVQALNISEKKLTLYAVTDRKWLQEGQTLAQQVEPVSYTHLDVYKRQKLFCTKIKKQQPTKTAIKRSCLTGDNSFFSAFLRKTDML